MVCENLSTELYVSKNEAEYPKTAGTEWALSTGALKSANINNIYDMAGNVEEWTMEGYSTFDRVRRGGSLSSNKSSYPGIVRTYGGDLFGPSIGDDITGFRICLYIK